MKVEYRSLLGKIEKARLQIEPLVARAGTRDIERRKVQKALDDLTSAIEELCVAAEVIEQQNRELLTFRLREEAALRAVDQERRRYQELFDFAPEGYLVTNADGKIEKANNAAAAMLRVESRFLAGKPIVLYLAPASRLLLGQRLQQLATTAGMVSWEESLLPRDGSPFPAQVSAAAMRDGTGALVGLLWQMRDITAWKDSERALQASEAEHRDLFENANDMLFTLDAAGRLTSINRVGAEMLGGSRDELVGRPFEDLMSEGHAETVRTLIAEQLAGRSGTAEFEMELKTKDLRLLPVEVRTRVRDQHGWTIGIHGIARDLTARRNLEARLRESLKLEAIGRLAGGVAHDFNNLLTVILGQCEFLRGLIPASGPARSELAVLEDAAGRAATLTEQLLAFGRRQLLRPSLLEPGGLIRPLAPLLDRLVGEHVEVSLDIDRGDGLIQVDAAQFEQVMINLALNARDAMPHGGRLTIATADLEVDPARAEELRVAPGSYLGLVVSDTGVGMNDATRSRIFEPFFTTKSPGKGNGLGLASAYGIVSQHGGFIEVDSQPGRGSVFRVWFPRAAESARTASEPTVPLSVPTGRTILLVEDREDVRRVVTRILRSEGYEVLETADAAEALTASERREDAIDLVLADMVMPGLSGRHLVGLLRRHRPGIRVLYMSAHPLGEEESDADAASDPQFIAKPFTSEGLKAKVREVLARGETPGQA